MKAKLIDNVLVYATNFEKIAGEWMSNPTDGMLTSEGFKDVVQNKVEVITELYTETETEILVNYVEANQEI